MRRCRYRLYPLVPAGRRQSRCPKLAARSDRPELRRHAQPNCARLATAAFPRHTANSRDLLDSASRGESRLCLDPLELRRVPRACFSLVGTVFATLPPACRTILRERGHMVLIASLAVSPHPARNRLVVKALQILQGQFASRDVGADTMDQGFRDPAIERWLRQVA